MCGWATAGGGGLGDSQPPARVGNQCGNRRRHRRIAILIRHSALWSPLPSPPRSSRPHLPFPSHLTTKHHGTSCTHPGRVLPRSSSRSPARCALPQSSGVGVNPKCLEAYQQLKLGKKIKYIIFTLSPDNTEIVVAKESESRDYDDFLADLPEAEPRWAVYDFEYEKEGAGKRNKITFFSWCACHSAFRRERVC